MEALFTEIFLEKTNGSATCQSVEASVHAVPLYIATAPHLAAVRPALRVVVCEWRPPPPPRSFSSLSPSSIAAVARRPHARAALPHAPWLAAPLLLLLLLLLLLAAAAAACPLFLALRWWRRGPPGSWPASPAGLLQRSAGMEKAAPFGTPTGHA
jgi:hypothetical protein